MNNSIKVRHVTGTALLIALVIVLQLLGASLPPVGGFTISLVLIPIVFGAAIYGPRTGALLGFVFSIVVLIGCLTGTDIGGAMVFQASPVLCIAVVLLKGVLAGFLSGIVYKTFQRHSVRIAFVLAAVTCPVINTGTFIVCMVAFFQDVLAVWAGGTNIPGYILTGLIVCNFIPELIINIFFSFAGYRIVRRA